MTVTGSVVGVDVVAELCQKATVRRRLRSIKPSILAGL
jgi:hypothetical protein